MGSRRRKWCGRYARATHASKGALSADDGDRAAAKLRIGGEAMQILVIRPSGANVWIEFTDRPDALHHFGDLIDSVTAAAGKRRNTPG